MSTYLFNRKAELTFGPYGGEGVLVTGLDMEFDIEKTSQSSVNKGKIIVYNLNPDNRAILASQDIFCKFAVGYAWGEELGELFKGSLSKSITVKQGNDFVSTLEIGDGQKELKESNVDKSYSPGIDLKSALGDVVKSIGLPIGKNQAESESFQHGLVLSGNSKKQMDKLTKKQGLEWSIQDGEIQILKPNSDTGEESILLTPSTGLIGSPTKREEGLEIKSLIIPKALNPGRKLRIGNTKDTDGDYKIIKSHYVGNTVNGPWYATCTVKEI